MRGERTSALRTAEKKSIHFSPQFLPGQAIPRRGKLKKKKQILKTLNTHIIPSCCTSTCPLASAGYPSSEHSRENTERTGTAASPHCPELYFADATDAGAACSLQITVNFTYFLWPHITRCPNPCAATLHLLSSSPQPVQPYLASSCPEFLSLPHVAAPTVCASTNCNNYVFLVKKFTLMRFF